MGEQGYGRISGKMQKMGELLRVKDTINDIIPETDGIPLIRVTNGNTPVLSMKPKERSLFPLPDEEQCCCSISAR
jgi:hypothetical protein